MAHAQKADFFFPRNGRVHSNRWGRQFSRLLVCASAWVMLNIPHSEVAWEYWPPTPFASFPFASPLVLHRVPPGSERALFLYDCHICVKSLVLKLNLCDKDVIKCDVFWTMYGLLRRSRSSLRVQLNRDTFPSLKFMEANTFSYGNIVSRQTSRKLIRSKITVVLNTISRTFLLA